MPASFFPVAGNPHFSSAFLDPVALDPGIFSANPSPVSRDPDIIRSGLNDADFLLERRRGECGANCNDTTSEHNTNKAQKG